jgi:hypothetical protein
MTSLLPLICIPLTPPWPAALTLLAVALNIVSAVLVAVQKFFKFAERVRRPAVGATIIFDYLLLHLYI